MSNPVVTVLNEDLFPEGKITKYNSLIWAERYWEQGDCELYLPATIENLNLLQIGRYLTIGGQQNMICVIRKIEIKTDPESGNYLIVSGYDGKSFIGQRFIEIEPFNGPVTETFMRKVVENNLVNGFRHMDKPHTGELFRLGTYHGLASKDVDNIEFQNLQDWIENSCKTNGWGYRVPMRSFVVGSPVHILEFEVYQGTDKSAYIGFTPDYGNITDTDYIDDRTNMGNVILVDGEEATTEIGWAPVKRYTMLVGDAMSTDRFEKYYKTGTTRQMSYSDVKTLWTGGTVVSSGSKYYYAFSNFTFPVTPGYLQAWLENTFDSRASFQTIDGVVWCTISGTVWIAEVPSSSPADTDKCTLRDVAYMILLSNEGIAQMAQYGRVTSFNGTLVPNGIFTYRDDYSLGDIVTVANEYGASAAVRITEAVEVWDTTGYSLQLKYESITQK